MTIHLPQWDEQYHSKHGAINEARHVFITMGLDFFLSKETLDEISILEVGFGTGLNAFITFLEMQNVPVKVDYTGVEAYPVSMEEVNLLNYPQQLSAKGLTAYFRRMHEVTWEIPVQLRQNFRLLKLQKQFSEIADKARFNLIYYDAFGARVQPELWTEKIFEQMYRALRPGGVLVTYSAKGSVRRALQSVGFDVARLPGPPGKREMLRGFKKKE